MMGEARIPNRSENSNATLMNNVFGCDGRAFMPQLFPSVTSFNGAASYIAQTTNLLTSCFSDDSVDYLASAALSSDVNEQELATFPLRRTEEEDLLTAPKETSTSAMVVSNNSGSTGISLFQGLIQKARKTVRGSADDIGWLLRSPEMPPIEDGTQRFNEIIDHIRHGVHRLPNSLVYLLVPGMFSNHGPLYFVNTMTKFTKMGLSCHIARIHSEASVENNAKVIKQCIEELYENSKKQVMILGHSKGGIDSAAALSLFWSELRDKVAGLALSQSPYGGSPIASDILREGQLGDYINVRKLMEVIMCKVLKGDIQALEDLTYERRRQFLTRHHLPRELPVVSLCTEVAITPAVLATLSHVAHAELPLLSGGEGTRVPVVIPLGAAMAACAQLMQIRYGEKSDGLVTCRDAEVPGSVVVRPVKKMDHGWMVYSSEEDFQSEPNASQVCEALLTLLLEVGRVKRSDPHRQED